MRKFWFILLLVSLNIQTSSSQVFCLPPEQPRYPEIALRSGLSLSFVAKFDVVGLSPKNIEITPKDSIEHANSMVQMFSPAITDYLNRLCFLKDITSFSMIVDFEVRPHNSINRGYVEKVTENRIHIVGRAGLVAAGPGWFDCRCKEN